MPTSLYLNPDRLADTRIYRNPLPWKFDKGLVTLGLHGGEDLDIFESKPTFRRAIWILASFDWKHEPHCYRQYRDWLFPKYDELPILCRLLIARYLSSEDIWAEYISDEDLRMNKFKRRVDKPLLGTSGEVLRLALSSDGEITPSMTAVSISEGVSLLHTFTIAFATEWFSRTIADEEATDIQSTLEHLIATAADIHHREPVLQPHFGLFDRLEGEEPGDEYFMEGGLPPATPLFIIIKVAALRILEMELYLCRPRVWRHRLNGLTKRWLSILEACGVNLQAYGEREHALTFDHIQGDLEARRPVLLGEMHGLPAFFLTTRFAFEGSRRVPCELSLRNFTYGPTVEDWSMEWDLELTMDVTEFWDSVEKEEAPVYGPFRVPGGWVEECSDTDE